MDKREQIARMAQTKEDEMLLARVYERMANAAARTGMRATFCEKERQVMVNGKPFVGYASTATGGGFFSKLFG